jgi:hypothetical protein
MKTSMTFTINVKTAEKFKKACKRHGIKQSVKVNTLIDDWLERNNK